MDHLTQDEETPFPVKDKNANEVLNIETSIHVRKSCFHGYQRY
jgi:hypothetical protein